MLSDRFRFLKIALLSLTLAGLCLYNFFTVVNRSLTFPPESVCGAGERGEPMKFGFCKVLEVSEAGTARMRVRDREVEIWTGDVALKKGDLVSFQGRFTPAGQVEVTSLTVHKRRWLKKGVSLLAALIFFFVMIRGVRLTAIRNRMH